MTRTDEPLSAEFVVRRGDDEDGIVLTLVGELDLASVPALEDALRTVEPGTNARLVLDLSRLMFMDSTGLAAVVGAQERADAHGRQLVLRRPTAQVRQLLALVGLRDHLIIEE